MISRARHVSYLGTVVAVAAALCVAGLTVNLLVDPLMFRGGNRLFDRNYVFNERLSKVAYHRGSEASLDCVIVGSSRMTFLDGRALFGNGCANYAFSGGKPAELLSYLEYLKALGARPSRVVVGVDTFGESDPGEGVPEFVARRQPMANVFAYYFSLDTLRYSLQTLTGTTRSLNYYDHRLRKHVGYPLRPVHASYPEDRFYVNAPQAGQPPVAPVYERMVAVFPAAQWIAVVPPASRWSRMRLRDERVLDGYVTALIRLAAPFDRLYDFSWLPDECMDYTDSYDGIHYSARVWDQYLARLADPADPDLVKGPAGLRPAAKLRVDYQRRVRDMAPPRCGPIGTRQQVVVVP